MAKKPEISVDVKLLYEQEIKRLRTLIQKEFAKIAVNLSVPNENVQSVIKQIQKVW